MTPEGGRENGTTISKDFTFVIFLDTGGFRGGTKPQIHYVSSVYGTLVQSRPSTVNVDHTKNRE